MDHRITTRIPSETYKKLAEQALRERKSESVVVREALQAHFEKEETMYDALMHLGGIGRFRSGMRDLGHNKKYMEGFGINVSARADRHRPARRTSRRK